MSSPTRSATARLLALAILAIVVPAASSARAEIRIAGTPEAVRLEANDATVDEALTALGDLGLRYRSAVTLDQRITGTYQGPLGRIISRLLDGHNFVVKTSSQSVQAMVLGDFTTTNVNAPPISAPGLAMPAVQANPMTAASGPVTSGVDEDPTITGLKRAARAVAQNPVGAQRIDVAQPAQATGMEKPR